MGLGQTDAAEPVPHGYERGTGNRIKENIHAPHEVQGVVEFRDGVGSGDTVDQVKRSERGFQRRRRPDRLQCLLQYLWTNIVNFTHACIAPVILNPLVSGAEFNRSGRNRQTNDCDSGTRPQSPPGGAPDRRSGILREVVQLRHPGRVDVTDARRGLSEAAVLWSIEEIAPADVIRLACDALVAGLDSQGLRELAGLPFGATYFGTEDLLVVALEELEIPF